MRARGLAVHVGATHRAGEGASLQAVQRLGGGGGGVRVQLLVSNVQPVQVLSVPDHRHCTHACKHSVAYPYVYK